MRKAEPADLLPIRLALARIQRLRSVGWIGITDLTVAMQYIQQAMSQGRVWFFGAYMVMVDVGSPWYSKKRVLFEELVLRVHRGDNTYSIEQVAQAGLDQLASHYGCEATEVGDSLAGLMTPLYIAAGFKPHGTQLFKENTHGQVKESHP